MMTSPSVSKNPLPAPRQIGLLRFSAAEFLIALLLLFIGLPVVEQYDKDKHIEVILMSLVLVSGVLAVGGRRRALIMGVVLVVPALTSKWVHHFWPELAPVELVYVAGLVFLIYMIWEFLRFILRAPRVNSEVMCAGVSIYLLLGLLWMFAYLLVAGATPRRFRLHIGHGGRAIAARR